jgi:hypothetical protein
MKGSIADGRLQKGKGDNDGSLRPQNTRAEADPCGPRPTPLEKELDCNPSTSAGEKPPSGPIKIP